MDEFNQSKHIYLHIIEQKFNILLFIQNLNILADRFPICGYRVPNKHTPTMPLCVHCLKNYKLHYKPKGISFLFAFNKHISVAQLLLCLMIKRISHVQMLTISKKSYDKSLCIICQTPFSLISEVNGFKQIRFMASIRKHIVFERLNILSEAENFFLSYVN